MLMPDGSAELIYTKRPLAMRKHAGEVSFPGGRQDEPDDNLATTALRETEEEIGLAAGDVEIIGALPPIATFVTSFAVYPFVGVVTGDPPLRPNPDEVAAIYRFGLANLRAAAQSKWLVRHGIPFRTPVYAMDDCLIWGATARITGMLLDKLPLSD